ncbi:MAG: hypothetical protein ACXWQR_19360 [Ktedonobacterales bacterium]
MATYQNFPDNARVVSIDGKHGSVVRTEGFTDTGEPLYTVILDDGVSAGIFLDSELTPEVV